eukprot:4554200-Pyramimonas_sp.AAC.1
MMGGKGKRAVRLHRWNNALPTFVNDEMVNLSELLACNFARRVRAQVAMRHLLDHWSIQENVRNHHVQRNALLCQQMPIARGVGDARR